MTEEKDAATSATEFAGTPQPDDLATGETRAADSQTAPGSGRGAERFIGQRFGEYEVTGVVGEGGMGSVLAGVQPVIGKQVAIKLLKPSVADDPDAMQRFLAEAKAVNTIRHPNIVDIFSFGELDDGSQYCVMEFLEGRSLQERLTRDPILSYGEAAEVFDQILDALQAAHDHGIFHRDLKPANIFLCDHPSGGLLVKLLDFGVAKFTEQGIPTGQTQTGVPIGTPLYMSPEQCRGKDVDRRSDLYAVGVILYQAFTGRPPFLGKNFFALLEAHTTQPPRPPEELADIPSALSALILECLAKEKQDRPESARALKEQLLPLLGRQEAEARAEPSEDGHAPRVDTPGDSLAAAQQITAHASPPTETMDRSRPSRWKSVVPVLAVAAAAAWAVLWWWKPFEERAKRADQKTTSAPKPPTQPKGPTLKPPRLGLKALAQYRSPHGSKSVVLQSATFWDAAAADLAQAAQQPGAPVRWRAGARFARAWNLSLSGKSEAALPLFKQTLVLDPGWAMAHTGLAACLARLGQFDEAIRAGKKAQRLAPSLWKPVISVARIYLLADRVDEAIQEYRRALTMAPTEPILLAELALAYHASRLDQPAVEFARKALKLDPDMVPAHVLLAERAIEQGRGAEALRHTGKALALDPRDPGAWLLQGEAQLLLHKQEDARDAFKKAVAEWKRLGCVTGVPKARMEAVAAALAAGKLPRIPRVGKKGKRIRRKRVRSRRRKRIRRTQALDGLFDE